MSKLFPLLAVLKACARWALCLLLAGGCAVGPDFVRPEPPVATGFTIGKTPEKTAPADGQTQNFALGARIAGEWWRLFKSPALDAIVREAAAGNRNLRAAQAQLLQSREKLRAGYGVFFPLVGGNFGSAREKFLPAQFGSAAPGSIFNFFTASASVSYALDVFGGERRSLENLAALAEYQKFVAAATYMTLLGNIVNAVVAGAAYRAEIEAVEEILRFEKEQLEISETQARAGIVPYANVTAIRAQVAATEAMLPPLRKSLDQALHLTAALAGRLPAQWTVQPVELADLALPADIPLSVPSELVRRRPDILAAEAQMHAALASVGVATAALFPSLTLDASFGQGSTNISQLLQKAANFWSIGASLATPALEGATLWYQRRAALRGYEASVANYEETVVGAFQQVADALRAVERDAETVQADSDALAAAGETLNLVSANHAAGLVNYLQVLTADAQYQQARLNLVGARALRLQDTSALFVALGGGWWSGEGEPDR